jgi:hypothetical protein
MFSSPQTLCLRAFSARRPRLDTVISKYCDLPGSITKARRRLHYLDKQIHIRVLILDYLLAD